MTVHHAHGHSHAGDAATYADDGDDVRLSIAYDRLTVSLQVLSAQFILLTADRSTIVDARDSGDARRLMLDEARSLIDEVRPRDRDRVLHSSLQRCLREIDALASQLRAANGPLAGVPERSAFVARLRVVAAQLARCADSERGLRFFGSGGCGDSDHHFLHI